MEGWSFLCDPCGVTLDKGRATPVALLKVRARKKLTALKPAPTLQESAEVEANLETTGESDMDDSILCGQGTPAQSTQADTVGPNIVSFNSLSEDSLFSQIPSPASALASPL